MNIKVTKTEIIIDEDYVLNDKEYNVNQCNFTFSEEYTNDLVKKAIFVQDSKRVEQPIINNKCSIPAEVLNKGVFELRVYAYEIVNNKLELRYSPSYATAYVRTGSYIENAEAPEVVTPTQFQQYMQAMNDGLNEVANVDIDAEQLDNGMSVTITNRYGEDKTVYAYDGEKGETGATPNIQIGTVVTGDHSEVTRTGTNENPIFNFVLEKGDKGDTGNGISNVTKTSTSGLIDTYTITYTNGTTTTFDVTNGKGIDNISKTSTSGLEDTYTITYNDNTTSTFTVTNGNGISSIEKTSTVDNVDTYTITYNDGTTSTFTVTNSTVTNQEFEELKAEHEELVNTLPRVEGTGESITLDNTAQYKMNIALNPSELSQDGTPTPTTPIPIKKVTGNNSLKVVNKNLFNVNEIYSSNSASYSVTNNNLTVTCTKDNSNCYVSYRIYNINKNTAYNFSYTAVADNFSAYSIRAYSSDGTYTLLKDITVTTNENTSFTTPNDVSYLTIYLYSSRNNSSGSIGDKTTYSNIQIELGSTKTSYEPYQGQAYPINLGSLEYCKIGNYSDEFALSTGKNLFESQLELGSINNNNGTPQNDEGAIRTKDFIEVKLNTTYTINNNNKYHTYIYFYDENQTFISAITGSSATVNPLTFTTTATTKYIKARTIASNNENDLTTIFMLNEGSTALPWEPYGIGNWYLKKNINKKIIDGSSNWSLGNIQPTDTSLKAKTNAVVLGDRLVGAGLSCYTDYFIFSTTSTQNVTSPCIKFNSNAVQIIIISTEQTADAFKEWVNEHNITIYYILATPTGEAITDTTLITQLNNLYNQIKSYKGQTNITQTNAELPFNIEASALYDLNNLISRVATLETEV